MSPCGATVKGGFVSALKCPTGLAYISVSPKGLKLPTAPPSTTYNRGEPRITALGLTALVVRFTVPAFDCGGSSEAALFCFGFRFKLSYGPPLIKTIGDRNLYRLTVSPLDWTTPPRPPAKNKKIPRLD